MLRIISLEEIKEQARIENNFKLEDATLISYGESAEETVLQHLGRSLEDVICQYGYIPANIKLACRMLATHWYKHRTPLDMPNLSTVPYTFDILIKPYVKL